jgi:hypothetical protein
MKPTRPSGTVKLGIGILGLVLGGLLGCTAAPAAPTSAPAPTTAPTKPTTAPAAISSPSPALLPSPSPGLAASPSASPAASPSASPAAAAAAPKPADVSLRITAPAAGQTLPAGSIQVTVDYSGPPLVAAASATKLDDYHLHYFLDENATPYIGTLVPVPMGNPRIIHTAATQVTFDNVAAGSHTLTVMLSGANHISVTPPVSEQVTFSVS